MGNRRLLLAISRGAPFFLATSLCNISQNKGRVTMFGHLSNMHTCQPVDRSVATGYTDSKDGKDHDAAVDSTYRPLVVVQDTANNELKINK